MDLLPLLVFFGGNVLAVVLSAALFVMALAKGYRRLLASAVYIGMSGSLGVIYWGFLGPWMKVRIPLFTGDPLEFVALLLVHTLVPCVAWILPGVIVHILVRRAPLNEESPTGGQ